MSTTEAPVSRWRRTRSLVLFVVVLLVVVVLLALAAGSKQASTAALDPGNPKPDGAKALAQVLGRHHVDVDVARGEKAFLGKRIDADTTVLVTSADELSVATTDHLLDHTASAGTLIVAGPPAGEVVALEAAVSSLPVTDTGGTDAACPNPLLSGLRMAARSAEGYLRPDRPAGTGCFPGREAGGKLTVDRVWQSVRQHGETYLLGAPEVLTNDRITAADNAAIALRLLGQHDHLVWYVANYTDVPIGDTGSVKAQLPRWLGPSLWLLAISVLALMLWRGRRLGRVVLEPLPVVVKGIESTLSRGRLYRKVRDRDHAARVLRQASRARITGLLRLPADLPPDALLAAVSRRTTRDPDALHAVLVDGPVATDDQLTGLAQALVALEKEVRQP